MSTAIGDTKTWPELAIGLYDTPTGRGAEAQHSAPPGRAPTVADPQPVAAGLGCLSGQSQDHAAVRDAQDLSVIRLQPIRRQHLAGQVRCGAHYAARRERHRASGRRLGDDETSWRKPTS